MAAEACLLIRDRCTFAGSDAAPRTAELSHGPSSVEATATSTTDAAVGDSGNDRHREDGQVFPSEPCGMPMATESNATVGTGVSAAATRGALACIELDRVRQAPHAEVAALACCCRVWSDARVDHVFDSCLQVMTTYCTGLRPHMPVCKKAREPLVRFHTVPCCDPRLSWALGLQTCRWILSPWMGRCEANPRRAQTMGVFGVVWIRLGIRLLQRQPGAPPSA